MQHDPLDKRQAAADAKGGETWLRQMYGLRARGWLALISLVLFVLFVGVLFETMNLMYRAADDPTVIHLQLAFTPERFKEILLQWSTAYDGAVETFKLTLIVLDYAFPVVFAAMLAFGYAWARGNRTATRWDMALFVAPFAAGLFDCVENSLHLILVQHVHDAAGIRATEFSAPIVFAASIFALAKLLLVVIVGCVVVGLLLKNAFGKRAGTAAR